MKRLVCIAPDGEFVVEGRFETVEQAWNHSQDMGSRWFFYPIHVVVGDKLGKIVDVPDGMSNYWIGKKITTLCKKIGENSQEICDWINGKISCPIYFP